MYAWKLWYGNLVKIQLLITAYEKLVWDRIAIMSSNSWRNPWVATGLKADAVRVGKWSLIICCRKFIFPACFLLWHFNNSVPRGHFPGYLQWDILRRTRQWVGSLLLSLAGSSSLNKVLRHPKWRQTRRGNRSRTITPFQWWHLLGMQTRKFQPRHFAFDVAQNSGFLSELHTQFKGLPLKF